jgi:hypothetical protein
MGISENPYSIVSLENTKDLILETSSTNTPENVINSIYLLKKLNFCIF